MAGFWQSLQGGEAAVVDQLDIEILLAAVFALEQKAISNKFVDGFIGFVQIGGGVGFELAQDGFDLAGGDAIAGIAA